MPTALQRQHARLERQRLVLQIERILAAEGFPG
jgi:hypothetical protein